MSPDEYLRATLAMTDAEWYAHDLTKPCEKGTKRCVAAHRVQPDCILIGPPRRAHA